jgi:glycine/D-amino acid oxidase-like deaminating enzyme
MTVDLLIVGGGMAGLAAPARAVELGLDVVVAEKGDEVGGSAALSAGIVWTATDPETARRVAPEGDPPLQQALVDGFDRAIERVRATGGFQGDRELVSRLIGGDAERMPVRSNPGSVGDGLRLGRGAGASLSRCLSRFTGHLIPDRLDRFEAADYLPLTSTTPTARSCQRPWAAVHRRVARRRGLQPVRPASAPRPEPC